MRLHNVTFARGLLIVALVAGGVVVGASIAGAVGGKPAWTNPDEGRPIDDVRADQARSFELYWERYRLWLADEKDRSVEPRSYPVAAMLGTVAGPAATLADAVKQADLIVSGSVTGVEFRDVPDSVVRIRITGEMKGAASDVIEVVMPNALMPDEKWSPVLGETDGMPMIYPEEEVVLFLTHHSYEDGAYAVQPWTGVYRVDGEQLVATPGNPFAKAIEAMTPAALTEAVEAANSSD